MNDCVLVPEALEGLNRARPPALQGQWRQPAIRLDAVDVSYGIVRAYDARRSREIHAEAGRASGDVFIPQSHLPGQDAEVGFGDVMVRLTGEAVTCTMFCLRLSYSGKAVHRVSATAGQEAFFEGHAHAFDVLGGVPAGKIRYDNLKAAVASVVG